MDTVDVITLIGFGAVIVFLVMVIIKMIRNQIHGKRDGRDNF
jgi:hypothetical protein